MSVRPAANVPHKLESCIADICCHAKTRPCCKEHVSLITCNQRQDQQASEYAELRVALLVVPVADPLTSRRWKTA